MYMSDVLPYLEKVGQKMTSLVQAMGKTTCTCTCTLAYVYMYLLCGSLNCLIKAGVDHMCTVRPHVQYVHMYMHAHTCLCHCCSVGGCLYNTCNMYGQEKRRKPFADQQLILMYKVTLLITIQIRFTYRWYMYMYMYTCVGNGS